VTYCVSDDPEDARARRRSWVVPWPRQRPTTVCGVVVGNEHRKCHWPRGGACVSTLMTLLEGNNFKEAWGSYADDNNGANNMD
jgi:hypothetical protein